MITLSDNMKFAAGFIAYIAYASWWAAGISAGVHANAKHSSETLEVLKVHMEECASMHERLATIETLTADNKIHIDRLDNIIFIPRVPDM